MSFRAKIEACNEIHNYINKTVYNPSAKQLLNDIVREYKTQLIEELNLYEEEKFEKLISEQETENMFDQEFNIKK